jgi:hypothetical protein
MNKYDIAYDELVEICEKIRQYYDIDKIKSYSVYIWTKDSSEDVFDGDNVFDILADRLQFYVEHEIIDEAKPIIEEIQMKLKEIEKLISNASLLVT